MHVRVSTVNMYCPEDAVEGRRSDRQVSGRQEMLLGQIFESGGLWAVDTYQLSKIRSPIPVTVTSLVPSGEWWKQL